MPRKSLSSALFPSRNYVFIVALVTVLFVKFLYVWLTIAAPVAYDAGINRYLFIRYADAFPLLPDLTSWFREHPPVLYYLFAPLHRLGLPVDWSIGWIWNIFCILLICVLARITSKRDGIETGICILFIGLVSKAYFDGMNAQYWKAYLALLFTVLAFDSLENKKRKGVLFLILCVFTHHQTALITIAATFSWWMFSSWKQGLFHDPRWRKSTVACASVIAFFVLAYALMNREFVLHQLSFIFRLNETGKYGGSFSPLRSFFRWTPFLLMTGIYGYCRSFSVRQGTLWQFAVLWCLIFVLFKLYFYRRFFLQLDFFLMPFAARALWSFIRPSAHPRIRAFAIIFALMQLVMSFALIHSVRPPIGIDVINKIKEIPLHIEKDASLIIPENQSPTAVLGWLPQHRVIAPGLFGYFWPDTDWDEFVFGSHNRRKELIGKLPPHTYVVLTPAFYGLYAGDNTEGFVTDPCFEAIPDSLLLRIDCRD